MAKRSNTFTHYFGQPIGNSQDPDEPYDKTQGTRNQDGLKIGGQGSRGGGSKPTPQRSLMTTGSGTRGARVTIGSSIPRNPQKLRG